MNSLEKRVWEKLKEVLDPELNISIIDLGLIYKVKIINKTKTRITMTLTSVGCPLFSVFEEEITNKVKEIKTIKEVEINLVFEPAWNMEMMSQGAREKMGII